MNDQPVDVRKKYLMLCSSNPRADSRQLSVQQDAEDHGLWSGSWDLAHPQDEPHCRNIRLDGTRSSHWVALLKT